MNINFKILHQLKKDILLPFASQLYKEPWFFFVLMISSMSVSAQDNSGFQLFKPFQFYRFSSEDIGLSADFGRMLALENH